MIISVASGKGGTGKTTVATNLAASLGRGVKILDCDVEEPNAHLFLNPEIKTEEIFFTKVPEVDKSRCTHCGKCADICRYKAIVVIKETILTFPELCHSCGGCMAVCPEKCITEKGRQVGLIETGRSGEMEFVHGRLKVGEAMSPPLINKVRSYADIEDINIIDAPPGTSCPVVTAMKKTDFVLMVTEPTPFGLHDLKLGVEAVRLLGIPCALVINRSDVGDNRVREYAENENLPVLLEIPFDRKIAEVYSRGGLIVDKMPEYKEKFLKLFGKIKDMVIKNMGKEDRKR